MKAAVLVPALITSAAVSIPLAFISLTFAVGDVSAVLAHPGFWKMLLRACAWLFVSAFGASLITWYWVARNK